MRKPFCNRMIGLLIFIVNRPGRCFLEELIAIEHLADQPAADPEIGYKSGSVDSTDLCPPVVVIEVPVENVIHDLDGIVTFARKVDLKEFELVLGGHIIKEGKQSGLH